MTKNICPTCQTEKLFISAWRESYTVVIMLRCQCKDWPVRIPNSRFPILTTSEMVEAMVEGLNRMDGIMKEIAQAWRW